MTIKMKAIFEDFVVVHFVCNCFFKTKFRIFLW